MSSEHQSESTGTQVTPAVFSSAELSAETSVPLPYQAVRKRRLFTVFLVLLTILLLFGAIVLIFHFCNPYQRYLRRNPFDYRKGEISSDPFSNSNNSIARAIAESIDDQAVSISAAKLEYTPDMTLLPTVTFYDYQHLGQNSRVNIETAMDNWMFTASLDALSKGNDCFVRDNDRWISDAVIQMPNLYQYCFAVESSENNTISYYHSFSSTVGETQYECEIWLMETKKNQHIVYDTLYRYYHNDTLCAVRVLPSDTTEMLIYQIASYSLEPDFSEDWFS